jgi:hypothetical protein
MSVKRSILTTFPRSIGFWILLFFLIRLVGITNPPLERGHHWRQITGLMVARNFLEVDANILYPRVDDHQGGTGIIGMEFPSLNYLHYLVSTISDDNHWYGRLINLMVSSIGLLFFFRIALRFFNHRIAFFSTLFLAGSIWFSFSRKMMPDTYCISLIFIGIYYGIGFLERQKLHSLGLFVFFATLGILSKIPAGIYLSVIILLMWMPTPARGKIILSVSTLIPLVMAYLWYFQWNPHLSSEFGNWYNIGQPLSQGIREIVNHPVQAASRFYFSAFHGYLAFGLFITGIFLMIRNREKRLWVPVAMITGAFVGYIFKSGFYFHHHNYYIIPYVPVMALVAGYAASHLKRQWIVVVVIGIALTESIANQQHDFFIPAEERYKMDLRAVAERASKSEDLIVVNGSGNPQMMYLAHRKGWNCTEEQLRNQEFMDQIRGQGAKYIIADKHLTHTPLNYKRTFENEDYIVYALPPFVFNNQR